MTYITTRRYQKFQSKKLIQWLFAAEKKLTDGDQSQIYCDKPVKTLITIFVVQNYIQVFEKQYSIQTWKITDVDIEDVCMAPEWENVT